MPPAQGAAEGEGVSLLARVRHIDTGGVDSWGAVVSVLYEGRPVHGPGGFRHGVESAGQAGTADVDDTVGRRWGRGEQPLLRHLYGPLLVAGRGVERKELALEVESEDRAVVVCERPYAPEAADVDRAPKPGAIANVVRRDVVPMYEPTPLVFSASTKIRSPTMRGYWTVPPKSFDQSLTCCPAANAGSI